MFLFVSTTRVNLIYLTLKFLGVIFFKDKFDFGSRSLPYVLVILVHILYIVWNSPSNSGWWVVIHLSEHELFWYFIAFKNSIIDILLVKNDIRFFTNQSRSMLEWHLTPSHDAIDQWSVHRDTILVFLVGYLTWKLWLPFTIVRELFGGESGLLSCRSGSRILLSLE